jgi:hypothetical protein
LVVVALGGVLLPGGVIQVSLPPGCTSMRPLGASLSL